MGKTTDNDIRNTLIADELSPYRDALEQIGIGPLTVAKKRKQQLKARSIKHIKIKGDVAAGTRLGIGYKVIAPGGVTETINGNIVFDDTMIEYKGPDWNIQERATSALEKIFDKPHKQVIEHTGEINMTNFPPAPTTMEEWEADYKRMRDRKKNDPNDPNAAPGS